MEARKLTEQEKKIALATYRQSDETNYGAVYAACEAVLATQDEELRRAAQDVVDSVQSGQAVTVLQVVALKDALSPSEAPTPPISATREGHPWEGPILQGGTVQPSPPAHCQHCQSEDCPGAKGLECREHGQDAPQSQVRVVRPTQRELYDRAVAAMNRLRPEGIGCTNDPASDDWNELEFYLAAYKPSAPAEDAPHTYTSTACYHGLHERCRKRCKFCSVACNCACHAERQDAPEPQFKCPYCGGSETIPVVLSDGSERVMQFHDCKRPKASVLPSTDDVVERSSAAYIAAYGETLMTFGERHLRGIAAAVSVARAGCHPWAEIEGAIRETIASRKFPTDCYIVDTLLTDIRTRLSQPAEPTERVTDPAVEAVREVIRRRSQSLNGGSYSVYLDEASVAHIVAAVRKADAQERGK